MSAAMAACRNWKLSPCLLALDCLASARQRAAIRQRLIAQSNVSSGRSRLSNHWPDLEIAASLLGLRNHMISLMPCAEASIVSPIGTPSRDMRTDACPLANCLADWVASTGKNLTIIYITHGHGDHWFGVGTVLDRFPNAKVVATPNTVKVMRQNASPEALDGAWKPGFPGQIPDKLVIAEELKGN